MSNRVLISSRRVSGGVFVLGALASVLVVLAASAAPALAATGNAYQSQFDGSETAGESFVPGALAVNANGDVYVGDTEHDIVDEFGPSGAGLPLAEFHGSETVEKAFDTETNGNVAVNSSGDLYVIGASHTVVDEFNRSGTAVLREFNGGETAGESFHAEGIAVDADGDVYVADGTHKVVDEFDPTASGEPIPLAEFNGKKTAGKSFHPESIAVNTDGDVYVGDTEHDVVDEFSPPAAGELEPVPLAELTGGETPQGSFVPLRISVAANDEVYAASSMFAFSCFCNRANVDRFSPSGTYEAQFEGGATPQGLLQPYGGDLAVAPSGQVYVDGVSGFVDLFSKPVTVPAVMTGPAEDIQETSVTLTGSIEPTTGLEAICQFRYGLRYGTNTSYATAKCVPAGPFSSLNAVTAEITGLRPGTAYHYRLEGTTTNGTTPGAEETFTTLEKVVTPPTVSIKPVKPIGQSTAMFNGKINPNEAATTYHFEYSTEAASTNWTPLPEQSVGEGSSDVPVTETATGLTGHTTYYVRLVAENSCESGVTGCGANTSSEETFATLAGPPKVSGTGVIDITAGEATLHATIDPENQPAASYRFEYGTTTAYGTVVPIAEGHVVGSTPTQVSQAIAGLTPDTTYHFRVVASNGIGSPTTTADQTFTTYSSSQVSSGCPNEQVRKESDVNPETGVPFPCSCRNAVPMRWSRRS